MPRPDYFKVVLHSLKHRTKREYNKNLRQSLDSCKKRGDKNWESRTIWLYSIALYPSRFSDPAKMAGNTPKQCFSPWNSTFLISKTSFTCRTARWSAALAQGSASGILLPCMTLRWAFPTTYGERPFWYDFIIATRIRFPPACWGDKNINKLKRNRRNGAKYQSAPTAFGNKIRSKPER